MTSKDSFTKAEHQLKELDMCGGEEAPKILLGNKVHFHISFKWRQYIHIARFYHKAGVRKSELVNGNVR